MIDSSNTDVALRLGVIGLGRAFTLMLPTFLGDSRVKLVAAFDPRPAARDQFVADFDGAAYADLDALLADSNVQAVYIASPHQYHAEQTAKAAAAGKHVLVEKPISLSLTEADSMIKACEDAGVHLIVGHCHSFNTPYLEARRFIEAGSLGTVRMIHAVNFTDFMYRPRRPEELNTAEGGGVVFSQAAHQVDVMRLLAGAEVVRVRALTGQWDSHRPTEGAYTALLWFENGAFANVTYSGYGHFDSDEWVDWTGEMGGPKALSSYGASRKRLATLKDPSEEAALKNRGTYGGDTYVAPSGKLPAGTKFQHFGPVIVTCDRGDVRPLPDRVMVYGDSSLKSIPLRLPTVARSEVIDELFAAIVHGQSPLHSGRWAKQTLEVCLALLESAQHDKDVHLPVR